LDQQKKAAKLLISDGIWKTDAILTQEIYEVMTKRIVVNDIVKVTGAVLKPWDFEQK